MATIRKVPRRKSKSGYAYQVMIRRQGYGTISKTFEKKADADKYARDQDREAKLADTYGKGYTKTVGQMIDKYMETYTGKDDTKLARLAWWKEEIGYKKLRELTPAVLVDCLDALREGEALSGAGKGRSKSLGRKRSEPTVNRYHTALSSVLEVARTRWHWIGENPARRVARGEENTGIVRWLDDDERTALLEACKESAWPQYFSEQDIFGQWLAECTETAGPNIGETNERLFKSWKSFCERMSEIVGSQKSFSQNMQRAGYRRAKKLPGSGGKRGFFGISINSDTSEAFAYVD